METTRISNWDEYSQLIEKLRHRHGICRLMGEEHPVEVLFRGQADADWELNTTLERRCPGETWSVWRYTQLVYGIAPKISTLTGHHWEVPDLQKAEKAVREGEHCRPKVLGARFWAYLRHHSFPSPLLDWSRSPFVAAFYAVAEPLRAAEEAAVYMYIEHPQGAKEWSDRETAITTYSHRMEVHPRHFAQQCQYTIATGYEGRDIVFRPHGEVFTKNRRDQDRLIKIVVPRSLRKSALRYLWDHNINHYTLMPSEEGLMRTVAIEEFELDAL